MTTPVYVSWHDKRGCCEATQLACSLIAAGLNQQGQAVASQAARSLAKRGSCKTIVSQVHALPVLLPAIRFVRRLEVATGRVSNHQDASTFVHVDRRS